MRASTAGPYQRTLIFLFLGYVLDDAVAALTASSSVEHDLTKLSYEELRFLIKDWNIKADKSFQKLRGATAVLEKAKEQKVKLDGMCGRIINDTLDDLLKGAEKTAKRAEKYVLELKRRKFRLDHDESPEEKDIYL